MLKEKIGEARAEEEGIKNVVFERETLSEEDVSQINSRTRVLKNAVLKSAIFPRPLFTKPNF